MYGGFALLDHSLLVELKFSRLEKGKDGSKAFAINTQEQWDEERPLLSGNTSLLQGRNLFTSKDLIQP